MIVLAEKGLWKDCPNKLVQFSQKEHKGPDVMKLNPRGQVPTFKDGDLVINESAAICSYLDETYGTDKPLIPKSQPARAKCLQRMYESDNLQSKVMLPLIYYKMRTKKEDWDNELLAKNAAEAKEELKHWEGYLNENKFVAGNEFTMADIFVFVFIAMCFRQGAKLEEFPKIKKFYNELMERPAIKETMPPHWADSPSPNQMEGLL